MKRYISSLFALLLFLLPATAQVVTGFGNFTPINGAGVALATSVTSASTTFTAGTPAGTNTVQATDLMLYNSGAVVVFCRWGVGAQTAIVTDVPLPPGTVQVFFKAQSDTVACLAASSTATVYVMPGNGR